MSNSLAHSAVSYSNFAGPSEAQNKKDAGKKRRLEEVLDLDLFLDCYGGLISTKRFRPDTSKALETFMQSQMGDGDLSLRYTHMGKELLNTVSARPIQFMPLEIPAFGTDPTDEVPLVGKFDLIVNTLTPLYGKDSPPLEHNTLLFQFMGLNRTPYTLGEDQPNNDCLQIIIESQIYHHSDLHEGETEVRLLNSVEQAFWMHLGDTAADPISTLVPFGLLQKHITDSNELLKSQYGTQLFGEPYVNLKEKVVACHGPDSVVALMVHMDSPEMFYDCFVPRGICSSTCTGKTAPFCNGAAYRGLVTLQTSGLLDIDLGDGDKHLSAGSYLDTAYLYLIVEMKQLVPKDVKFNYPWIRMLLTPRTVDQVVEDIVFESKSKCYSTRNGSLSSTVVKPLAKLRVGPHCVGDSFTKDSQQLSQFDLLMSPGMKHCRIIPFQDFY